MSQVAPDNSQTTCSTCGATPKTLLSCPCGTTQYCSTDCQTIDWNDRGHKKACKKIRDERAAALRRADLTCATTLFSSRRPTFKEALKYADSLPEEEARAKKFQGCYLCWCKPPCCFLCAPCLVTYCSLSFPFLYPGSTTSDCIWIPSACGGCLGGCCACGSGVRNTNRLPKNMWGSFEGQGGDPTGWGACRIPDWWGPISYYVVPIPTGIAYYWKGKTPACTCVPIVPCAN